MRIAEWIHDERVKRSSRTLSLRRMATSLTQSAKGSVQRVVVLVGVFTIASGAVGALLDHTAGDETLTILSLEFVVSPGHFAAYGFVAVTTFVVAFLLVLTAIDRLDESTP